MIFIKSDALFLHAVRSYVATILPMNLNTTMAPSIMYAAFTAHGKGVCGLDNETTIIDAWGKMDI